MPINNNVGSGMSDRSAISMLISFHLLMDGCPIGYKL